MNTKLLHMICSTALLITVLFVSGCGEIPISAQPTERFVNVKAADSLVGRPKQTMYERFNRPNWELEGTDKTYHIYSSKGKVDTSLWIFFFFPYIPIPGPGGSPARVPIFCAVFETDKTGNITRFDSDWKTYYSPPEFGNEYLNICLYQLWDDKQVTQIKNDLRNNLQSRAEQGDREAAIDLAIWFYIWEPLEVIAKHDQQAKQILESLTGDDTGLLDPSAPGY